MGDELPGALTCAGIAVVLLSIGVREAALVWRLRRHGIRPRGVVVDNVRVNSRDSGPSWTPVIAFADRRGHRVEFTPRMLGTGLGLATGREVRVVYMAQHPQTARVLMARHMVGPVLVLLIVGVAFLGIAVLIA